MIDREHITSQFPYHKFLGEGEAQMQQAPPALRQKEYYGKPDATAAFYRKSGAFAATEEKD